MLRQDRPLRFQDRARALREQQLLQASGAYLLWRGCLHVRLEDVATACGVARGTCYRHFPTRLAFLQAAVEHLDQALVARLATPPTHLRNRRAVLRWTIGCGMRAQIETLGLHKLRQLPDPEILEGTAWPCCLTQDPCPYRGAARSLEAIDQCARGIRRGRDAVAPLDLVARLLVHLVPRVLTHSGLRHREFAQPERLQAFVDHLLDRLIPAGGRRSRRG